MSSGLDWERFGVITGGDEVCILPPPTLSEKGVGIPTFIHFPYIFRVLQLLYSVVHKNISTTENVTLFSGYSSFVLLYPKGAPRFLRSAMTQPISRLPLLLSATCGTAYDALMSPLCTGATQI